MCLRDILVFSGQSHFPAFHFMPFWKKVKCSFSVVIAKCFNLQSKKRKTKSVISFPLGRLLAVTTHVGCGTYAPSNSKTHQYVKGQNKNINSQLSDRWRACSWGSANRAPVSVTPPNTLFSCLHEGAFLARSLRKSYCTQLCTCSGSVR